MLEVLVNGRTLNLPTEPMTAWFDQYDNSLILADQAKGVVVLFGVKVEIVLYRLDAASVQMERLNSLKQGVPPDQILLTKFNKLLKPAHLLTFIVNLQRQGDDPLAYFENKLEEIFVMLSMK